MTRALALSQRQVRAICEGAKKAGYAPVIQVGNILVRLIPEIHAIAAQTEKPVDDDVSPEAFDTLDEYLAWRDRSGAGGA